MMGWLAAFLLTYIVRLLFILTLAPNPVKCLRLTNMSAPALIDYKEDLKLDCQFDMGGEQLYAVKWYKDDQEFFRYMPNLDPHELSFPVFGVKIYSSNCDTKRCQLILSNLLRIKSSGAYRCEVSSEAPAFRLASETHNVTVAAVPRENPIIDDLDDQYFLGDILTAKCISAISDPPQTITWYINKEQVPTKFVRDLKSSKPDNEGLVSTSQVIRFVIEEKYIHGKYIDLSCVTAIEGTPVSARRTSKSIALFDHDSQMSHPRYTYWYSSGADLQTSFANLFISLLLIIR